VVTYHKNCSRKDCFWSIERESKGERRKTNIMAFNPKFTITPKINKALVEIERVRGFLDAVKLKGDWIADMQKQALILESHHSTHIEGTALSLEQAKSILEGKKVKGVNRDDEKELLNYNLSSAHFR